MTNRITLTIVALVLGTAGLLAQARPNFAGRWALVDPTGRSSGVAFLGIEFTATQDDAALTVVPTNHEVHVGESPERLWARHNLDGSESHNPLGVGRRTVDRVSVARWNNAALVITSTIAPGSDQSVQTQTWSLDPSGSLIVDAVRTYNGQTTTMKAMYRKKQ
jgi:hypothetical protein